MRCAAIVAVATTLAHAGSYAQAPVASGEPQATAEATHARALFERGLQLTAEGRHAEAAESFERSYGHYPRASTALNWAIVLHRLGRSREALRALDGVDANRDDAAEDDLRDAEALRERLRGLLATLRLRVEPEDARVEIDGRIDRATGAERLVVLDPGRRVLRVEADGFIPQRLELRVAAGEELSRQLTLDPIEAARVAASAPTELRLDEAPPRRLRRAIGVSVVVVAVAVLVGVLVANRPAAANGGTTGDVLRPFE